MGTIDPLRQKLASRKSMWVSAPNLHFEFHEESVEAVFDGRRIPMTSEEVAREVGRNAILHNAPYVDRAQAAAEAVAMLLFKKLIAEFGKEDYGSWDDAKMMAEKAKRKAERIAVFTAWIVHVT